MEKIADINSYLREIPRDGRRRYHVALQDGRTFCVNVGPGTRTTPPNLEGPWARFELEMKKEVIKELEPHLDSEGKVGYVAARAIDRIAKSHGGYLIP